jgi:hypothetical protein
MNPGIEAPNAIFLVKCADYKCLAIQDANGKWKSFHDNAQLPDVAEIVLSIPFELVRPFLPASTRQPLCPIPLPAQK